MVVVIVGADWWFLFFRGFRFLLILAAGVRSVSSVFCGNHDATKQTQENTHTQTSEPRLLTIGRYSSQTNTALVSSHACYWYGETVPQPHSTGPLTPHVHTGPNAQPGDQSREKPPKNKKIKK